MPKAAADNADPLTLGEGWEPDDGDVLVGTIKSVTGGYSKFLKGNYPILSIKAERGTKPEDSIEDLINVHCFHMVLFNRILALKPVANEKVSITYLGKATTKDGEREVAVYSVEVEGRGEVDPYGEFSASPQQTSD